MKILRWFGVAVLSIVAFLLAVDLLTPLPSLDHRTVSEAFHDTEDNPRGLA